MRYLAVMALGLLLLAASVSADGDGGVVVFGGGRITDECPVYISGTIPVDLSERATYGLGSSIGEFSASTRFTAVTVTLLGPSYETLAPGSASITAVSAWSRSGERDEAQLGFQSAKDGEVSSLTCALGRVVEAGEPIGLQVDGMTGVEDVRLCVTVGTAGPPEGGGTFLGVVRGTPGATVAVPLPAALAGGIVKITVGGDRGIHAVDVALVGDGEEDLVASAPGFVTHKRSKRSVTLEHSDRRLAQADLHIAVSPTEARGRSDRALILRFR